MTLEIAFALAFGKRVVPVLFHVSADQLPAFVRDSRAFEINDFDNYLADLVKRKGSHA